MITKFLLSFIGLTLADWEKESDIQIGAGFFIDDDGNEIEISRMSDGRYDHLGHIPDLSLPTNSYVWVQIPFWRVIESPVRT
jgi:hypothetical protein